MSNAIPVIGSDNNTWGTVLNQYLATSIDVTTGYLITATTNPNPGYSGTLYPSGQYWTTGNNPNWATTGQTGFVQLAGDLNGTSTAANTPRVGGLQSIAVSATTPTTGQVLQLISSTWTPTSYGGDVTGSPSASTVAKIQGVAVSSTAPTTGYVLEYNGTQWAPTPITSGTQRTFAFFAS